MRSLCMAALFAALTSCVMPVTKQASGNRPYYTYVRVSPFKSDDQFSELTFSLDMERMVLSRGHGGERIHDCQEHEQFHCFSSHVLSFAVPRKTPDVGASWAASGFEYRVVRKEKVEIFGVSIDTLVINQSARESGFVNTYYYSIERGLIGLSLQDSSDGRLELMLSTSGYGFPAMKNGDLIGK